MFEFLRDFPLTVFGIVMERPPKTPYKGTQFLQTHYRWLLEQIERFMEQEQPDRMAIPVFDNLDPHSDRLFADCLTAYMARSRAGKALQHVVPKSVVRRFNVDARRSNSRPLRVCCAHGL